MAYVDDLETARDGAAAQLATLSTASGRKLTYTLPGGLTVDWLGYQQHLLNLIKELEDRIVQAQSDGGAYEFETEVVI